MTFFVAIVGLPLLVIVISAAVREYHRVPQTTASDMLAFLVILDGTMILDTRSFSQRIAPADVSADLLWIGVLSLVLSVCVWQFCLLKVEPAILRAHRAGSRGSFPWRLWLFATTSVMVLFAAHAALLTGRVL